MNLYLRQQVYQLDELAIECDVQSSQQLMGKAASSVWQTIQQRWPELQNMVVFAGSGNNGGDAFAVAQMALQSGVNVSLFAIGDLDRQSTEAAYYRQGFQQAGGQINSWSGQFPECELIVDGLLGIGLDKPLDEDWQYLIASINQHEVKTISIDIPSGLNADNGNAMPCAIEADVTVTFIGCKLGCFVADGPDYCGELLFDDLGVSSNVYGQITPTCKVLDTRNITLPLARKNNSHKNRFGHVLIIGGDRSMVGACQLAGIAALRAGAGVVSLSVHPDNYSIAAMQQPELMVSDWRDLEHQLMRASIIVIGPGLGTSPQAVKILKQVSKVNLPLVVDADALTPAFISSLKSLSVVLTPHPGEAGRLLASTSSGIQQDRLRAVQQICHAWGYVTVLKGAGTLVCDQNNEISLCRHGHPGMATAGMGDVLAGLIAGYLAQDLTPLSAAKSAVMLHALAAENYALNQDANSLIASDIVDKVGTVVKEMRQSQSVQS